MVVVPLAALTVVLGFDILRLHTDQQQLRDLAAAASLAGNTADLVHELQRERGRSSLYLSGSGQRYLPELELQWTATDVALAALEVSAAGSASRVADRASPLRQAGIAHRLGDIQRLRGQVGSRDITPFQAIASYTQLIQQLRGVVRHATHTGSADPRLGALAAAADTLSEAIEAAGVERATIGGILSKGTAAPVQLGVLTLNAGRQQAALESLLDRMPSDLRDQYRARIISADDPAVASTRERIGAGDLAGVDATAWFDLATGRIDALTAVQDDLLTELRDASAALADQRSRELWTFAGLALVILLSAASASTTIGRRLSRRTTALASVARAVQAGDLSRRAEPEADDELGCLADTFNRMTDDLVASNTTLEQRIEARTAELRALEAQDRAMLDAIPDVILRLDRNGIITRADARHSAEAGLLGSPDLVGCHIGEVVGSDITGECVAAIRRSQAVYALEVLEVQMPVADEVRDYEARIVPIPGTSECLAIVRDISEAKAAELRLHDLIRSKDELIAAISHQIRTPLTAVLGFSELLQEDAAQLSTEERHEMIETITQRAFDISNVVQDLVVAARADIERLSVARVSVSISAQIAQVLESMPDIASQVEVLDEPITALGDPERIRQILRNLLNNAAHHGGGRVEIWMGSLHGSAWVQVRDDGECIAEEEREAIFERYHRTHVAPGQPSAVGLGLTVSRTLARLMGGDLTYRCEDATSVFELTLPEDPTEPHARG